MAPPKRTKTNRPKKPAGAGSPVARSRSVLVPGPAPGKLPTPRVQKPRAESPPAPAPAAEPPGEETSEFPIVGIGASAGGLEALEALFSALPAEPGMAFVVVTHQHTGHTSLLPEILSKTTAMPVLDAADGLRVERNCVYVSPPGCHIDILAGTLHRTPMPADTSPHLPIDHFLRSLAADQKERAICIILSGAGTDGTQGLKVIKAESGMVMVQQVQTALYAGMPTSAVATGLADYVLPIGAMAEQLLKYARGPYLSTLPSAEQSTVSLEPLQKILAQLRSYTGHDFSGYKANTIRRRIERRMNMHQLKDPNQYLRHLQENPHELNILFKELLISVTSFFRDPEACELLGSSVLPELLKSRPDNYTLRAWVPGCATGEEVYSLAILLRECMEAQKRPFTIQLFGTDLDQAAIDTARDGLYPDGIAVDVSPPRLERFFNHEDGAYRIRKDIREMAIFAVQNVIKDPPFTKLDLISCRNLLIYLNADLQKRLLPLFRYALKPGGLLFLGPSETIGGYTDLFDIVDKKWKVFRRKESPLASPPTIDFAAEPRKQNIEPRPPEPGRPLKEPNIATLVDRMLLARFAPASVVCNERGDVVYIHGRTGHYLEPAAGQPRLNVLDMAREGLQLQLASALREASAQDGEILREGVRVRTNGDFTLINLRVMRMSEPETLRGMLLVTFQPRPVPPDGPKLKDRRVRERESSRIGELERELHCTKESLQTTIEELETSNEELKSTNEELQSTNEELETSKEEMQSLNEELTTVNAELHSKVEDLSRANDDMQNLLNSTEIATIFLDRELNIKRYTEQARRLVNLIQTDVGRPLADLVSNLNYDRLVSDGREVLRTLVFKQSEVQTKEGQWYLARIMPYRTADNVIDGLVLTFVDINPVKEAQKTLRRMSKVFTAALDPVVLLDLTGHVVDVNDEAVRCYGFLREELCNQPVTTLMPKGQREPFKEQLVRCRDGETVRNVDCVRRTKDGRELPSLMTLSLLTDERGEADAMVMLDRQGVGRQSSTPPPSVKTPKPQRPS